MSQPDVVSPDWDTEGLISLGAALMFTRALAKDGTTFFPTDRALTGWRPDADEELAMFGVYDPERIA